MICALDAKNTQCIIGLLSRTCSDLNSTLWPAVCCFLIFTAQTTLDTFQEMRSAAAHLLRSWVRIPPGAWIFVCCECRVLSGRVLCEELITRPEEAYRLCCVVVCDLETSRICAPYIYIYIYIYDISSLRVKTQGPTGSNC